MLSISQTLEYLDVEIDEDFCKELETHDINTFYKIYNIRTGKAGKLRKIEEPCPKLKHLQRQLIPILEKFPLHKACCSRKGNNILNNAIIHKDAQHLLKLDIKECYHNISYLHIYRNLHCYSDFSYQNKVCLLYIIDKISMIEDRLPTGAPTSPILCNIALTDLDCILQALANNTGHIYSRYMDDIHFSTKSKNRDLTIKDKIIEQCLNYNLQINTKKTRWMNKDSRDSMIVTGVSVGGTNRVPREFRRTIRSRLHQLGIHKKQIDQVTQGCLAYIKYIDPNEHQKLVEYYHRRVQYAGNNERSGSSPE